MEIYRAQDLGSYKNILGKLFNGQRVNTFCLLLFLIKSW